VSNVRASQRAGDKLVDILYDLADVDGGPIRVTVTVSTNGGATFDLPAVRFSGAGYGYGMLPGANKQVVWDARSDWDGNFSTAVRFRVTADDTPTNHDLVLIPAGPFTMGDNDYLPDYGGMPWHTNQISAFYMDKYEVTKALWDQIRTWGNAHGYDLGTNGFGKAANHPVYYVSWHDAVKFCNARSEQEGRTPAYYTDAAQVAVYRNGVTDVQSAWVKWNVGYRLPTEAEWEKAARGGVYVTEIRFPWPALAPGAYTITQSQANYYSDGAWIFDLNPTRGFDPRFQAGGPPYTSPVGYFQTRNNYGLADMAGNVNEWTWDRRGIYNTSPQTDPHGPESGNYRVMRGGSYNSSSMHCRTGDRYYYNYPTNRYIDVGFRTALPLGQP
jgi:formylglycine-generating enzyme required for sulfatase activity